MRCTASLSSRAGACSAQTLEASAVGAGGGAVLGLLSLQRVMDLLMSSALCGGRRQPGSALDRRPATLPRGFGFALQ